MFSSEAVVITPCKQPPSVKHVEDWLEGKTAYQRANNVTTKQADLTESKGKESVKHKAKNTYVMSQTDNRDHNPNSPLAEHRTDGGNIGLTQHGIRSKELSDTLDSLDDSMIPSSPEALGLKTMPFPRQVVFVSSTPSLATRHKDRTSSEINISPIAAKPQTEYSITSIPPTPSTSQKHQLSRRLSSETRSLRRVLLTSQIKV